MSEDLDPVQRLVEQIQAGVDPEESFRRVFQLYHPRVEAFFLRKGFSPEETRDLAQETFFRVFKALPSFRHESSFPVWLFGITTNIYWNEIRRRKSDKRVGLEVSVDTSGYEEGPSPELKAQEKDALGAMISRERRQALQAALRELPGQMRLCCILRYERDYKYQEIAHLMAISIDTVKAHLYQGRKRLRATLGDTEPL